MPRHFTAYEPDWIDVNTQLTALGEDFGVRCVYTVTCERDRVTVLAKCHHPSDGDSALPRVQALASKPIKSQPNLAVMCFAVAQDCWRQLDRGVLGTASEPIAHEWSGRPQVLGRARRK